VVPRYSTSAVQRFLDKQVEVMAMATVSQKRKVEKVTHEYKEGDLKSSSGRKVKSRKQAVAIVMSESAQSKQRKKAS
jgi:hypothetical protein